MATEQATFEHRRALLWPDTLAPTMRVYAVVDCARDDDLFDRVASSGLEHACLFRGELSPAVLRASPWLVRLDRDSELFRVLITEGWGRSWCIFLQAPVDLAYLRRHLRKFLRAKLEDGGRVLFRFFDPRVFRRYLPTMNADEHRTIVGPMFRIAMEDEDPEGLLSFALRGTTLESTRLSSLPA